MIDDPRGGKPFRARGVYCGGGGVRRKRVCGVDVVVYVFRNDCGKIGILYKTAQIFETLGRIAYIELVEYGYVYHQLSMHCPPVTGIACPVSYFCSTA